MYAVVPMHFGKDVMKIVGVVMSYVIFLVSLAPQAQARPHAIEVSASSLSPGATLSLSGTGFGVFQSVHANRVTVNGVAALIQRWDPGLIEIKVPFKATTGPVEIVAGKKKIRAGAITIVAPQIDALIPAEIERGAILRITGKHFGTTAGARDPNTMFGVNDVVIGGIVTRPKRWRDNQIEVEVPANAQAGDVIVRLASSDPLPDGSCCAPVEYRKSNAVPLALIPAVRVDPISGPVGTKVVLFGKEFGVVRNPNDAVFIGDRPMTIAQWKDDVIVVHVPLGAESGSLVLQNGMRRRTVAQFTVHVPKVATISPLQAPIGTLLRINGEHFGAYSESGATPYNFMENNTGNNRVDIGGVPAIIYRWNDNRIDVWVPYSAKSGKVIIYRGANRPNADGLCCAEQSAIATEAGEFTVVTPVIESYSPTSAGLDDLVTIKGAGFGVFLKTAEHTDLGLSQKSYKRRTDLEINESDDAATVVTNVSRTEVLFNGAAAIVQSWTDSEIIVRVPHRNLYGIGKRGEFFDNLATGPLVVRRGSWDVLPDGTCCLPKQWHTIEAGPFTIEAKGLPDSGYFNSNRPDANTNQ